MQTADRVRQILSSRGLTLYQVSQRSAEIFGQSSPFFIPQGLYHELAIGTLSPNIHQMAAFSQISNYRLCDWLAIFGFRLDDIPRLQLLCPWKRTVLLDSSVYDEAQWIPWFTQMASESELPAIAPLGQVVRAGPPKRARELLDPNRTRFLYVKIGRDDVFAFPSLAPGSIARIDIRRTDVELPTLGPATSRSTFLVEHGPFLNCGHLRRIDGRRVMLCSPVFPFAQVELTLGRGVRILGVVTSEIRPLSTQGMAENSLPPRLAMRTAQRVADEVRPGLQNLLRVSRMRVGISFREASVLSQRIARTFSDRMYFAAAGTLSDYENASSPLRHVQKIISLCALYCIDFWSFIRAGGLQVDSLGNDSMSDEMVMRPGIPRAQSSDEFTGTRKSVEIGESFLSTLISRSEEVPLFIKSALTVICALKDMSLSDIFWVGGNRNPSHPSLIGAALVAVNRRIKTPPQSTATTAWEQPLYVILKRDGSYLCAACELRRGMLTICPHSEDPPISIQFRNGVDAEIVGRVTAIVRNLG